MVALTAAAGILILLGMEISEQLAADFRRPNEPLGSAPIVALSLSAAAALLAGAADRAADRGAPPGEMSRCTLH